MANTAPPPGFDTVISTGNGAIPEGFDTVVDTGVESRIKELGGVKQPDGSYLVPGDGGTAPFRLDAEGNRLDEAPAIGEESTAEAIGNRALATAASGAQGFIPQLKGAEGALQAVGQGKSAGEGYRAARDSAKATIEQARDKAGLGYDIAGSVLSGGIAAPETALGRVALSAGLGAVNAAAGSDVDLTKDADGAKFAGDVAMGAGIGAGVAGLAEGATGLLRSGAGKLRAAAGKVAAKQAAKDAAIIEAQYGKGVIPKALEAVEEEAPQSLPGRPGYEMATEREVPIASQRLGNAASSRAARGFSEDAGMKLGNVSQRGYEIIEGSRFDNLPPPPEGPLVHLPQQATPQDLAAMAADRTADYFRSPVFKSDILPAIQKMAPRFGRALVGAAAGAAFDEATGSNYGKFIGGSLGVNIFNSPAMKRMMGDVAKSPRVQRAVLMKLAPLFESAASIVTRGAVAGAAAAFPTITEEALGPAPLVAEQLISRGGLRSVLGDNGVNPAADLNAPRTELDRAIQQTTGVLLLGGALEDHNTQLDKGIDRLFKGKGEASAKSAVPEDLAALKANPEALLERLANNTGNLSNVAPQIAAELAATAQRATDYLLSVAATPPKKGPMAPDWVRSETEKRSLRLAHDVVSNPLSVLDAAAAGTLVPEQVAALNAVYPMLGRSMADRALSRLQEGAKVPYRARLMVGFLTGVDVDGTLASIGPNQATIRAQSQKPSNAGAPDGGADKLTVAARTAPAQQQES